jgi:uncharacterized protein (TIGR03435 family)
MSTVIAVSFLFLAPYAVFGQAAPAPPAFDVASVKVSEIGRMGGEGSRRESISTEPGSLTMRNVNMVSAIGWAYGVEQYEVSGPGWMRIERYDIVAKAAAPAPEDQLRLMLQTLLANRFQLALHREEKAMPTYILTVAKGGPKFHESTTEGQPEFQAVPNRMSAVAQRFPVSQLVVMLQRILQAPVVDKTGLKGRYDISVNLAQYVSTPIQRDDVASVVVGAVQDLLGLKMEEKKAPVDMVIVDHAERVPTEN